MTGNTIALSGYQISEQIYEGSRTLVYRGMRETDSQPAIIKVLRNPHPRFHELVKFRNQYIITRHLESPHIVRPLALERCRNGYALVMPDEGAISLPDYWQQSNCNFSLFLTIAIQLAEALHYLGQQRIIHKDIKPANILVCPKTQQVQLIDFSISSLLPKETQEIQNPNVLEGTLAYISPEQTGRMNRGIDYRTDFYSLGVTFYELLAGERPFNSEDLMELVHSHIAKPPVFSKTPNPIPPTLSRIVMKLMAKNAEDRYQSALGLKYDLENCLAQYQETGTIELFELGARDLSDRFNIPEKLYGREAEVATLLDAFDRVANGSSEMLLVAGFSGIGKTAAINEVHKPIVREQGYFIKGKFDQFNRNIPFSAVVQAFQDLMGQLLSESPEELRQWKSKILEAVGENGQVLIDVIPELERIVGPQSPTQELVGAAAQNRFNVLFQQFMAVFATPEHPLVLFLDDLQWADPGSLKLLELLMTESQQPHLLLLGAYRDCEVSPTHPLILVLDQIRERGTAVQIVVLTPLSLMHLNLLVAATLRCEESVAFPLAELIHQKTQGNPFFATQFLKGLYDDRLIRFDPKLGVWQCDLVQVRKAALTEDVVTFMANRLYKLPPQTQDVVKLGACIGNQFSLETLAIICDRALEVVATDLWHLLQEGLLLPLSKTYKFFQGDAVLPDEQHSGDQQYRFLHDRVQQAAYTLIPEAQRAAVHLKIGRLLLRSTPIEQQEQKLFAIANQLNQGIPLIADPQEQLQLAQFNLQAGRKARAATAYQAAGDYFSTGRSLLPPHAWDNHYTLALNLTEKAAEAAFLQHDYTAMADYIATLKQNAKSEFDCVNVYHVELLALYTQGQYADCLDRGLAFLAELGLELPNHGSPADTEEIVRNIEAALGERAIADLVHLLPMRDRRALACMKILAALGPTTYAVPRNLTPLVVGHQVRLSIEQGNAPESAYAYAMYSLIVDALTQDTHTAYAFGKLSLGIFAKGQSDEFAAKILSIANSVRHWFEPLRDLDANFKAAYPAGLAVGDYYFATGGLNGQASNAFYYGESLDLVDEAFAATQAVCQDLKQVHTMATTRIYRQTLWNLQGKSPDRSHLQGEQFNAQTWLSQQKPGAEEAGNVFFVGFLQLILCYLFEDWPEAIENANLAKDYLHVMPSITSTPLFFFYDSLMRCALYSQVNSPPQHELLETLAANQAQFKNWSETGPMNYLHKYQLVEAERARLRGDRSTAIDLYERAITGAKNNKFIHDEALANELAAKFCLIFGQIKRATHYMQEAYYCYARWGAKAKTDHLEANYPELLTPILQQQKIEFNPTTSLETLTRTLSSTQQSYTSSGTNLSEALDFTSILQAGQTLSHTLELDQLLDNIVRIILTNAGVQKVALLIPQEEQWQLRAIAQIDSNSVIQTSTELEPLTAESPLPIRLVRYVINTQQPVLINEGKTKISGILEGYLLKHQPQSALCTPLLNQNKLVAILYLEHPTTQGIFTSNRQTIVQFLCAQAAIALENAQLYQTAQDYAQQLSQSLQDLQDAQLQLVQNEKMATLGNLVAGVAHEINNPLSFIGGNVGAANDYIADLFEILQGYQDELPNPSPELAELLEELDLDFIEEDLPKLITSMQLGVKRIGNISTSLRTFSRADTADKTAFNLHDGLDSTLLILKYRLKANEQRPAIEIVKDYGELPEVQCFPGQLNQAFMNLLANAIDAFEELNEGRSYTEIEAHPNRIVIRTEWVEGHSGVAISIADNGPGMSEEVQQKIFGHLFTTKGVGKGTGLGLSISRQIVEEKHGGTLSCQSEIGNGTEFTIELPVA